MTIRSVRDHTQEADFKPGVPPTTIHRSAVAHCFGFGHARSVPCVLLTTAKAWAVRKESVSKVDAYYTAGRWLMELAALRNIAITAGLTETFKWRSPCYTSEGRNIILIGRLKDHAVMSFLKGALIEDTAGLLEPPGEHSQSVRVARFQTVESIEAAAADLGNYIHQAVKLEAQGRRVPKTAADLRFPDELVDAFSRDPALSAAFHALTPGRQRGYCLYIAGAKQAATRVQRIDRYRDRILSGKGLHDCICGRSKKMPGCDGSHKNA